MALVPYRDASATMGMPQSRRNALTTTEPQRSTIVSDIYDAKGDDDGDADLLINNLNYKSPEAVSLVMERAYQRQAFQQNSYAPRDTAICVVNSGSAYSDPENGYLAFDFLPTAGGGAAPTSWDWGIGSATNLIRSIVLKSRSGEELDRVDRCNLLAAHYIPYTHTKAFLQQSGAMSGWGLPPQAVATQRFAIPLGQICPFFRPVRKGQKIPPHLLAGLEISITFEDAAIAYVSRAGGSASQSYTVTNIAFMFDNSQMTEDIQKTLNMQSAVSGLEYAYPRWFTAENPSTGTDLSVQIHKAVTMANVAFTIPLVPATSQVYNADSMAAEAFDVDRYQYRLGNIHFPRQALEEKTAGTLYVEAYAQMLETFDKFRHPDCESSVSLADFRDAVAAGQVANTVTGISPVEAYVLAARPPSGGHGSMCVSLEKDASMNLSGLPLNNSRVLELIAVYNNAATRLNITFLEYNAVARSYMDNVRTAS